MNENLKIIISAEVGKLKSAVQDAKSSIQELGNKSGLSAKDIENNFKSAGASIQSAMSAVGKAVAAAGAALLGTSAATKEYQINQAKLETAFKTAGASAATATETYNGLYRVLGDSDVATEAAGHLAKMTTNQKDLSEWTSICQGVYATFGDSLPIEGLTEAANETAKVGTVTGSLADALNWAGISEDAFNEKLAKCNSEAEREKLIRETLNGVYSAASAEYEKSAAGILKQNEAQAKLMATLSSLGEAMSPLLTMLMTFANDVLSIITPYIEQFANEYGPVLEETLNNIAEALETAFEWASQHKELLAVMAGIILTVVAAIGLYNAVAAIKTAMAAAEVTSVMGLVAAYTAQAAAMLVALAPYILITAAIAAVIAIIVLCITHWDEIKAKVTEVAKNIANKVSEMKEKVIKFFGEIPEKVKAKIEELKQKASAKFEEIKTTISNKVTGAKEKVVGVFGSIKDSVSAKVEAVKTAVSEKFEAIKTNMRNKVQSAKESVVNIFGNIKEGIANKIEAAKEKVKSVIDKIKGFFKFKWSLPKLKLPKISISGKFSLAPPSVPKFSISWNKLGGVFDKPTLFSYGNTLQGIGEDGAEAVVPLEKNTQWLDRLADRLAAKQNGVPIVLQIDGKTFAQVSIDSINSLTRQRGKLGLNLV